MCALFADEQEPLWWLPYVVTIAYVLLGFVLFGNWEGYGCLGKTIYFLIFPFHTIGISIYLSLYRGVNRYLALWKMAFFTVFVILLLFVVLMMMAQH